MALPYAPGSRPPEGDAMTAFVVLAGTVLLFGSYYLFPLVWAPLLVSAERMRSGLKAKRLTVDGRTFSYLEGGHGVPVVMLHGFGANSDHWTRMASFLTERFRILAPDLPGFGETSASRQEQFFIPLQAQRVHAFLHALRVQRYHLVANSMGGNIAGVLAREYPDEVASLTLFEPQGVDSRVPTAMDLQIRRGETPLIPANEAEFDRLFEIVFVTRPFIPRALYVHLRSQALALETRYRLIWQDLWHPEYPHLLETNLPFIRAPTLVVWGDSNRFLHETAIEKLERALPDVRVVRMKACGHAPMLERPVEAGEHFQEFIGRLEGAPSQSGAGSLGAKRDAPEIPASERPAVALRPNGAREPA